MKIFFYLIVACIFYLSGTNLHKIERARNQEGKLLAQSARTTFYTHTTDGSGIGVGMGGGGGGPRSVQIKFYLSTYLPTYLP